MRVLIIKNNEYWQKENELDFRDTLSMNAILDNPPVLLKFDEKGFYYKLDDNLNEIQKELECHTIEVLAFSFGVEYEICYMEV